MAKNTNQPRRLAQLVQTIVPSTLIPLTRLLPPLRVNVFINNYAPLNRQIGLDGLIFIQHFFIRLSVDHKVKGNNNGSTSKASKRPSPSTVEVCDTKRKHLIRNARPGHMKETHLESRSKRELGNARRSLKFWAEAHNNNLISRFMRQLTGSMLHSCQ